MKKLLIILMLFASPVWGATYYMNENGSAANVAAAVGPCETVANTMSIATHDADAGAGAGTIAPGDTIIFCNDGGDYTGQLDPDTAGTSGNIVTYRGETGVASEVVFDASGVNAGIFPDDMSYMTFKDFRVTGALVDNIRVGGNSSNMIFDNLILDNSADNGLFIYDNGAAFNASDITVQNCVAYDNNNSGLSLNSSNAGDTINNITFKNNITYGNAIDPAVVLSAGIKVDATGAAADGTNIIIENNTSYDNIPSSDGNTGNGIYVDTVGAGLIIRYNELYGNYKNGMVLEFTTGGAEVYGNVVYNNTAWGISLWRQVADVKVYHNTVTGNSYGIVADSATEANFNNNIVRNNISTGNTNAGLYVNDGAANVDGDGTGNIYNNNALGAESTNFLHWNDTSYSTYDTWISASSQTDNNIEADPLFTSTATNDYSIPSESPAKGAGTDLGATYERLLVPGSTFPHPTLDVQRGAWDIGAYKSFGDGGYPTPKAPTYPLTVPMINP